LGQFANPLASCLVFAPLLVETTTTTKPTDATEENEGTPPTVHRLEWVDAVLVGLQATACAEPEPPNTNNNNNNNGDDNQVEDDTKKAAAAAAAAAVAPKKDKQSDGNNNNNNNQEEDDTKPAAATAAVADPPKIVAAGGQTLPPAIAAQLGRMGAVAAQQPQQPQKQTQAKPCPTGNLLPFCEQSRKRLTPPWTATGGFVRALACIPKKYVIGVTEKTTATATTTAKAKSASEKTEDAPPVVPEISSSSSSSTTPQGPAPGQASEIILWDATQPGTVLHRLQLWGPDSHPDIISRVLLRGTVFGFWRSTTTTTTNPALVVAVRGAAADGSSKNNNNTKNGSTALVQIHINHEPHQQGRNTAKDATNANGEATTTISIGKTLQLETPYAAAAAAAAGASHGDTIALADSRDVVLYQNLSETSRETLLAVPSSTITNDTEAGTASGPNALVVAARGSTRTTNPLQLIIAGYPNGELLLIQQQQSQLQSQSVNDHDSDNDDNEDRSVSECCSSAPPGLRGMLCPHLTAASNQVQLQNQCAIQ